MPHQPIPRPAVTSAAIPEALDLALDGLSETIGPAGALAHAASLFTLGDGLIGVRGFLEEQAQSGLSVCPNVYLNAIYDIQPIRYHEAAHGFASSSDTRLPAPDGFLFDIMVEGRPLAGWAHSITDHRRRLCFTTGLLERWMTLAPDDGAFELELCFRRSALVSQPGLAWTDVTVTCVRGQAALTLTSHLLDPRAFFEEPTPDPQQPSLYDPRVGPAFEDCPWVCDALTAEGPRLAGQFRTRRSDQRVTTALLHELSGPDWPEETFTSGFKASLQTSGILRAGQVKRLGKWIGYGTPHAGMPSGADTLVTTASAHGLESILAADAAALAGHLRRSRIELAAHPVLSAALAFSQFQLFSAVGRGGALSIGAKGQSGEGYEGHVFWDAETYCLPAFVLSSPELARGMLRYRHRQLPHARAIAHTMGHQRGALFPWRSISGRECSAFFPAGTAQYHINSDIALAVRRYMRATEDWDFLADYGFEIVVESARIWLEIGFFDDARGGAFVINKVTGPDEYTALVDNNLYTNVSAAHHLRYVEEALAQLNQHRPERAKALLAELSVSAEEIQAMQQAAAAIPIPTSADAKLYAQDDSFLNREVWDLAATPADKFPLLLHYHPLTLYRYQVCKQADTVLAFAHFPEDFDVAKMTASFHYYEAVTTHDSTLSPGAFALVAARLGLGEKALRYLLESALIDIADLAGNTDHGLHMAATAASWTAVVEGAAGLYMRADGLWFHPQYLPAIGPFTAHFQWRGTSLSLAVGVDGICTYTHEGGPALVFFHHGERARLEPGTRLALGVGQ